MEENGAPREKHRPVASHWQTLWHTVVSGFEHTALMVIGSDCIGSCKSKLPYDHDHDSPNSCIYINGSFSIKKSLTK